MEEQKERVDWKGHYISNPELFKAVAFATQIRFEGKSMSDAVGIAAHHYKVPLSSVALEIMVDEFLKKVDSGF